MMFPTELVYNAVNMPLLSNSFSLNYGHCALCRRPFHGDGAVTVKDAIKETFTNRDLLDPRSQYVCVACAYCLRDAKLRRKDFVACENELRFLQRNELVKVLLNPPIPPFIFCIGLSHKKHLVIRTRVNLSRNLFYVQFEEQGIWVQPDKHKHLAFSIQALIREFSKGQVARGEYFPCSQIRPDELFRLDNIVKPYRGSSIFNLFLHASQSQEKKQNE